MSNVEHAFENLLKSIKDEGNLGDGVAKWKQNDINLEYMSKEQIDAVKTCATYVYFDLCHCDNDTYNLLVKF